jgi:hypothetical protein
MRTLKTRENNARKLAYLKGEQVVKLRDNSVRQGGYYTQDFNRCVVWGDPGYGGGSIDELESHLGIFNPPDADSALIERLLASR